MALSGVGGASGINVDEIVGKLMQVEARVLVPVKRDMTAYQQKISAYGALLNSLSALKASAGTLKVADLLGKKAASSDTSVFTATAGTGASAGSYSIKVSQTATAQGIYSPAFTAETDAVADLSAYSTQKINIQVGSSSAVTVTVDSSNNTLYGIRDAINGASAGVKASIINDGTGYRLILTGNSTGASNRITVKVDENNNGTFEEATAETDLTGLSRLALNATYDSNGLVTGGVANMTQSLAAKDASLVVNGLTVTRSSNTISDLITGVTLTLLKDSAGSTLGLTVSSDGDSLKGKVTSLVSAYNQVMTAIKGLKGDMAKKGALYGDSLVDGIASMLRGTTTTTYGNSTLAATGITHDKNGVLGVDSSSLDSALSTDAQGVVSTLNAMGSSLESALNDYTGTIIPNKNEGYKASISMLTKKEEAIGLRLMGTEKMLKRKFSALERTLSMLQSQENYISQQMSIMSRTNGGGK
ncbi:MAG: flagellar filament capping protein FliD [Deltaproteobacteria bacterium]|nr:flagellar filament capping protein FliD [Deltaproteobacteria bacterium]